MELRTLAVVGALLIIDMVQTRKTFLKSKININCECGISGEGVSNRIVGGKLALPHIYPWVVAIFNKRALHCGGSLINDRYILTAGHCIKWTNKEDLVIGVGMHDIKNHNEGHIIPIAETILHEDFKTNYLHDTNDIALIKLKYPVQFNENIKPVCLPHKVSKRMMLDENHKYDGQNVHIAGWGRVFDNGGASRFLRQTTLKVIPWLECRNTSIGNYITKSMICAYTDNTDACQGDSGGSLLSIRPDGKYETIGTVSWGIGCAKKDIPGVYVKNTDYLDWIKSNTKDAIYCIE